MCVCVCVCGGRERLGQTETKGDISTPDRRKEYLLYRSETHSNTKLNTSQIQLSSTVIATLHVSILLTLFNACKLNTQAATMSVHF